MDPEALRLSNAVWWGVLWPKASQFFQVSQKNSCYYIIAVLPFQLEVRTGQ